MTKVICYKPIEGFLIYGKIYDAEETNGSYEVICENGTKLICNNVLPYSEKCVTHSKGHKLICIKKEDNNVYPNTILELGKIYHNCILQSYYRYVFWSLDGKHNYTEINLDGNWLQPYNEWLAEWRENQINKILEND